MVLSKALSVNKVWSRAMHDLLKEPIIEKECEKECIHTQTFISIYIYIPPCPSPTPRVGSSSCP